MGFNLEQKHQVLKWHFLNSIRTIPLLFTSKYGRKCSRVNCERVVKLFEKNGCLHSNCRKCALNTDLQRKIEEENEETEILVCAAAELELSNRDIGLELGINPRKVSTIMKKYGYALDYEAVASETVDCLSEKDVNENIENNIWDSNLSWEEKKVIIKWYYAGNSLSKVIEYCTEHFEHSLYPKYDVYYTVRLFKKYSCIRNCEKCACTSVKFEINEKEVEAAIAKETIQKNLEKVLIKTETKENEVNPLENTKGNIKTDLQISQQSFEPNITNIYSPVKYGLDSPPPLVDRHGREFLLLEPTMGIVVINDKTSQMTKRMKLS